LSKNREFRNKGTATGTVAIVCHDTGAANALSSFFLQDNIFSDSTVVVCTGYASAVFRKAGIIPYREYKYNPDKTEIDSLFDELKPVAVLSGTSFDSWAERWFCLNAKEKGIYCIAFVDWWSNFGARFSNTGSVDLSYLPDAIAVIDEDARMGCVGEGIPGKLLHVTGNPYWDYLIDLPRNSRDNLRTRFRSRLGIDEDTLLGLIISSNLRNLNLDLGYDERDFIESILPLPDVTDKGIRIQWVVKAHPKESTEELTRMLVGFDVDIQVVDKSSGIDSILGSDFVLGMCSSLLFEAALIGKKIVSLQPGLNRDKLNFLKIFDHLGVPKITEADDAKDVVNRLVNDLIPDPDLNKLTFPVGGNSSAGAIAGLLKHPESITGLRGVFI
jgi:hypothetical protein